MKKYTFLLFILLFCISVTKAQIVQIENAVKAPGDIAVKVEMLGFTGSDGSVQSIQFQIAFDDNLLYFKGVSNINTYFPGWVIPSNGSSSPITLSYISMTGHDIDTKIFDLLFGYAGGFSGNISFIPSGCEITRGGLITMTNVTYVNGSVSQTTAVASVNFGNNQQAAVTSLVTVPVNMQGTGLFPFSAFTYRIGYDPAKLTYVQVNNSILGGTLVESATGGVLTVTWNGSTNSLPSAHVFDIMFTYNGGGDAPIDFLPGSLISTPSLVIIPTTYTGMIVQNLPGSSTISMPNLGVALNTSVSVPITLDYTGSGFVGGVNLNIGYSNSLLVFNGFSTGTLGSGITASASGGVVSIVWNNPANTANLNGVLLNLNFTSTATTGLSQLTFDAGSIITQTNLANVGLTYINGSIAVGTYSAYSLSGTLTYFNASATPLSNTTVLLKQGGITITQTTTNGSGYFIFNNLANGTYILDGICTKPWGGVNSSDALIVMKHYANFITLTGIKLAAADVNASNSVNALDAMLITKRFTNMVTSFAAGDWVFSKDTVIINGANVTKNIKALCYGDVNGSFSIIAKMQPEISLEKRGYINLNGSSSVVLPVKAVNNMEVGAISLVLYIPDECLQITNVRASSEGDMVYNLVGNELRLSWYSLQPMNLQKGDPLLWIEANLTSQTDVSCDEWIIGMQSQLADGNAEPIQNAILSIPRIVLNGDDFYMSQNVPNPFTTSCDISYYLPETGKVLLKVYDMLGSEIKTLVDLTQPAGTYTTHFLVEDLPAGIYCYKIEVNGTTRNFTKTKGMVVGF